MVHNICHEDHTITLGDETTKIFLNTRGKLDDVSAELKEFLTYVENTTDAYAACAENPLIREIHEKVKEVKQSKEMEVEYMTLLQRDRENIELGREEGREEGRVEGLRDGSVWTAKIIRLYHSGMGSKDIAEKLDLDMDYVTRAIYEYENA